MQTEKDKSASNCCNGGLRKAAVSLGFKFICFPAITPRGRLPPHPLTPHRGFLSLDETFKGQKSLTLSCAVTVRQEGCMGKKSKRRGNPTRQRAQELLRREPGVKERTD